MKIKKQIKTESAGDRTAYQKFIQAKSQSARQDGFEPGWMPDFLYDFQQHLAAWAIQKGRAAIFADCGLGKTPMQLVWAENVCRKANGKVIILTPLAVAPQSEREANKFEIDAKHTRHGAVAPRITVTNYQQLDHYSPDDFSGVVCDESSAIKAFDGKMRKQITRFMSKIPYRLLCTATAAPNDFIELGTQSEALGVMNQSDMLSHFFKSSDNMRHSLFKEGDFWNRAKWFFKAHAETPFWQWVCAWARALKKPSDLGFSDARFILPPLITNQITVKNGKLLPGELFPVVARTLKEQRNERRLTMVERCEKVAEIVSRHKCSVVWCHLNPEGDMLEKIIPGAKQVYGSQDDDEKEAILNDFTMGNIPVLITKPKIGAWGLNWQHCDHMTFFPSHSFEQYYQGVRRCWRFGQKNPVTVDIVTTEGEAGVTSNLQKKSDQADRMFAALVAHMNNSLNVEKPNKHINPMETPIWL